MKKIPLALVIVVSGIVAFSFSPMSKDLKKSYDEYWKNKYWEKENPRREAQRLKEIENFKSNSYMRKYTRIITGTKIIAEIRIKPKDRNSCFISTRILPPKEKTSIAPFPKKETRKYKTLILNVSDSDGFTVYQNDLLNKNKPNLVTNFVNDSDEIIGAEIQYTVNEPISLFEDNNISLARSGGAAEYYKNAEQFIKPKDPANKKRAVTHSKLKKKSKLKLAGLYLDIAGKPKEAEFGFNASKKSNIISQNSYMIHDGDVQYGICCTEHIIMDGSLDDNARGIVQGNENYTIVDIKIDGVDAKRVTVEMPADDLIMHLSVVVFARDKVLWQIATIGQSMRKTHSAMDTLIPTIKFAE